jgi:hypothetical protein
VQVFWIILANVVVALHVGYVSFVVLGQLAILIGWWRRWDWVRRPWFRLIHLAAILIVAGETVISLRCPLTTLENYLRELGGQSGQDVDFVGRVLQGLIFLDLPDTHWIFKVMYFGFAALVLLTLVMVPPRRPAVSRAAERGPQTGSAPPRHEPAAPAPTHPGATPPDPPRTPSRAGSVGRPAD